MLRRVLLLAALVAVLAACDESTPTSSTTTRPPTVSTTVGDSTTSTVEPTDETTVATTEPETATITVLVDDIRAVALAATAERFTADTGITVEFVVVPVGELRSRSGDAEIDIFMGSHLWLADLQESGAIIPVDGVDAADFSDAAVAAYGEGDRMLGVPFAAEGLVLFRNTALVPEPLADLEEGCPEEVETCLLLPGEGVSGGYHLSPFVMAGADSPTGLVEPADPRAVQALGRLLAAGVIEVDGVEDARRAFARGQVGLFVGGPWDLGLIEDSGLAVAVTPLPTAGGAPLAAPSAVQAFHLSATAPEAGAANWFLAEYVASAEAQRDLFERDRRAPVWSLEDLPPIASAFAAGVDQGFLIPGGDLDPFWEEIGAAMTSIVGGADPVQAVIEALARAAERLDAP